MLTRKERLKFAEFSKSATFPDGYASNISRCVNAYGKLTGSLKRYVRNKAHPEGSIAEGYVANECLTFLSLYLDGVETRFNKPDRNNDKQETHDNEMVSSNGIAVEISDGISTSLHRVGVESHIVEAIVVQSKRIEAEGNFVISDEDESPIEYDSNEEEMNDYYDETEDS
nr:uncharacterized protein LOC109169448 [Ipomoea batatas]